MKLNFSSFLNLYKNKLLDIVSDSLFPLEGLEVSEFSEQKFSHFVISIKGTPLEFQVRQREIKDFSQIEDGPWVNYRSSKIKPGFPLSNWLTSSIPIDKVCLALNGWLNFEVQEYYRLAKYADIPDLWTELQNIQPLLSSGTFSSSDFEMFTDSEKIQIQASLSEFQRMIREEISPVKEDLKQIQEKLQYLDNAVNRLNRFDWKGVALSTVIGIATNMTVDIGTGQRIIELFRQSFVSAIRLLPK